MEELNFNFRNVIWHVLRKWKKILIIAFSCAVLFGLARVVLYTPKQVEEDIAETTETQILEQYSYESYEAYNTALYTYNTQKTSIENEIESTSVTIGNYEYYISKNLIMSLNYENIIETDIYYYVDVEYEDDNSSTSQTVSPAAILLNQYETMMLSDDLFVQIRTAIGYNTDIVYLKDVLTCEVDTDLSYFKVSFKSNSSEENAIAAEIIDAFVQETYVSISSGIMQHDLLSTEEITYSLEDVDVKQKQSSVNSALEEAQEILAVKEAALTELIEPVWVEPTITSEVEVEILTDTEVASTRASLKSIIIYAFVGGVLGALAAIAVILAQIKILNLFNDEEGLVKNHGIKLLGKNPTVNQKSYIDRLISKWSNSDELEDLEEFYDYVIANLNLKFKLGEQIYLTGTTKFSKIENLKTAIEHKVNANIICVANALVSSQALEIVANAENIILVEELFKSKEEKVEKEIDVLKTLGKKVDGIIVL